MSDTFTQRLLDDLAPFTGPVVDPNGNHATYLVALGQMFEQVFGLCMDQGFPDDPDWTPGWGTLLDVDTCPAQFLPFLAQFNGTSIPAGTSEADARTIIRTEAGMQRGTVAAMTAAAKRQLTGTQTVIFQERTAASGSPDPYHAVIGVFASECANLASLEAAVEAVKPGGIQITYVASAGFTWDEAIHTWNADTFTWNATFTTQP